MDQLSGSALSLHLEIWASKYQIFNGLVFNVLLVMGGLLWTVFHSAIVSVCSALSLTEIHILS